MPDILMTIKNHVSSKFGTCRLCMRKSFLSAGGLWLVVILLALTGLPLEITLTTIGVACVVTTLWLTHMLAFAGKTSKNYKAYVPVSEMQVSTRRALMPLFARAVGAAVIMSAAPAMVPRLVSPAMAQNVPCGCLRQRNPNNNMATSCGGLGGYCGGQCGPHAICRETSGGGYGFYCGCG
jgi:hypothetical protein